jgi:hypothetical protein
MRDYLDEILSFIGSESLTDEEFTSITLEDTLDQIANYNALLTLLHSRESVSETKARLQYYFLAKGIKVTTQHISGMSNIFVGSALE